MIRALTTFIIGALLIAYSFELTAPGSWFFGYAGIILFISGMILLFVHFDNENYLNRGK